MKNCKYYQMANDQIVASEVLKKETKEKLQQKPITWQKKLLPKLETSIVIVLLAFSILWFSQEVLPDNQVMQELLKIENEGKTIGDFFRIHDEQEFKNIINQTIEAPLKTTYAITDEIQAKDSQTEEIQTRQEISWQDTDYHYQLSEEALLVTQGEELVTRIQYDTKEFLPSSLMVLQEQLVVMGSKTLNNPSEYTISEEENVVVKFYDKQYFTQTRQFEIEGSLLDAEGKEDILYLVASKEIEIPEDEKAELRPYYLDTAIGEEKQTIAYEQMQYMPGEVTSPVYTFLVAISPAQSNVTTYLDLGENACFEDNYLYVSKVENKQEDGALVNSTHEVSSEARIYQFALDQLNIQYISNKET